MFVQVPPYTNIQHGFIFVLRHGGMVLEAVGCLEEDFGSVARRPGSDGRMALSASRLVAIRSDQSQVTSKPWRIFYAVEGNTVLIAAVLDGRRDIQTLLERRLLR